VATQGRGGRGCVILFAAGNEDRPLDGTKDGQRSVQGFALHPDVIAVAASNSLDQRSDYSNFGAALAICAPTSGAPGRRIVTTDRLGVLGYDTSDYTQSFGGTSSATPLAAGLAGLILSVNPNLTAREVKQIMMETADEIDAASAGYVGGHSEKLGHGRIHAGAAVRRALGVDETSSRTLYVEHRVAKAIRDESEASDSIDFPLDAVIDAFEVHLELLHTWIGDLRILLVAPDGTETVLHDRSGGSQDDLQVTYRSGTGSGWFTNLLGKSPKGRWRLRITDHAAQDEGALQKWGLAVTYRGVA
jgi:subtilisin-like proprotein convertase family protein